MEGIKITKRPKLKDPYLIVAWPGMGDVAFRAATYLVETLKAQEFAQMLPDNFFFLTGSEIKQGVLDLPQLPQGVFYYWKNSAKTGKKGLIKTIKNDLIIFISNAQPDLSHSDEYCHRIIALAKSFKVKTVVSFAAMPQAIDHTQASGVWLTATSADMINSFKNYNFNILSEGQISGMNGLFLGMAKHFGLQGICFLGEIPLYTIQIDNPKASATVLDALNKILKIQINLQGLYDQAHNMEDEINKLLEYLKLGTPLGPIGEEEIEKIKKSLSQLTKLPVSVKEKIEKLFQDAKLDISRAGELKLELDRWNVYKDYEDRFLDLFNKRKEENN